MVEVDIFTAYICVTQQQLALEGLDRIGLLDFFFFLSYSKHSRNTKKGQNYTTADHVELIFTRIYLDATYAFHNHPIHVCFTPQPLQVKIKQAPLKLQQKQNL